MRGYNNMRKAQPLGTGFDKLPAGGYVCRISNAVVNKKDETEILSIEFDISEGEYVDYFKNQYENSTYDNKKYKGIYNIVLPESDNEEDYKMRRLKTFIESVESSNNGYRFEFNERTLIGKIFGAIFGEKEYSFNDNEGICIVLRIITTADNIRQDKYTVPALWKLKNTAKSDLFDGLTKIDDDELPF